MVSPCKVSSYKMSGDLLTKLFNVTVCNTVCSGEWCCVENKRGSNQLWPDLSTTVGVQSEIRTVEPPKYKSETLPLQPNKLLARQVVIISCEGVCE